jgi:mitochondrial ornithine carrier protein
MEFTKSPVPVVESGGKLAESFIVEETTSTERTKSKGGEALKEVVCGSVAGIVGKYIEYPFDTVKVRLQSQPDHLPLRYTGPLDCFKQSLVQDGFIGIYRGISAPLVGAAVENACLFFSVSRSLLFSTNAHACNSMLWQKTRSRHPESTPS